MSASNHLCRTRSALRRACHLGGFTVLHARRRLAVLAALALAVPLAATTGATATPLCEASSYVDQSLSGATPALPTTARLRFANLSDSHILDDEASPVITGNYLDPALEPPIANNSAQRLQEEYTDEVLNAMVKTINACDDDDKLSLMIATGDLTDNQTLNETRRYIDNLDGVSGQDTAYEKHCGYTTHDSNGNPKLGALPCTPEMQALFAGPTGKLAADTQQPVPDVDDPTYQLMITRTARQLADTKVAAVAGGSEALAPGLPPNLRCNYRSAGCENERLAIPHLAVFGNHDSAVRGTVTFQQPFQAGSYANGRYFFESQREFINEWFESKPTPGPVGHGFNYAGPRLTDEDDRNDGYYAFSKKGVRLIVLNTIYDGVQDSTHRHGQTNTATGGVVSGNEVTNPAGAEMGVMSQAQYDWLANELAIATEPVIVFSHHPDRSFSERRLTVPADGGKTAAQLDELIGSRGNVIAHIAGHTHENVIRACRPGPGNCPIGGSGGEPNVAHGFWRIETASLIDYPQEGRIVEVFDVPGGHALRLTMIRPDPTDPTATLSRTLSEAEATCTTSAVMGGPASSGPYNQARLAQVLANAGEAAVQGNFCQGQASLALAAGDPTDRDTVLYP